MESGTWKVKTGLAQMLKGGVIMDVVTPEHARIAQEAGACAVMALERVPSDIRAAGGVARMADPTVIENIKKTVSIPVMAKCRIRRCLPPLMKHTISGSMTSRYPLSVAVATSVRHYAASAKGPP